MKNILVILIFVLLFSFADAQKRLVITNVKNNHSYSFREGKKILCKTYNEEDSVFERHHGILTILSDSLIQLSEDTLVLNDITSVKKYNPAGAKISLSCLFMYLPFGELISIAPAVVLYNWALSQGLTEVAASSIGIAFVFTGAFVINYLFISNSTIFKAFNKVGTKYSLQIQN
jgi:hypothetical protein